MTLKTKEIEVDGRKVIIHELTLENQFNLEKEEKWTLEAFYKECMSEEDFEFCKKLPFRIFSEKIGKEINKLNSREGEKSDTLPLSPNSEKQKSGK